MKDVLYFAPIEIDEALKLLAEYGARATILAGGTDLVPKFNYYDIKPEILLYVGGLGLDYIREDDGKLLIGSMTKTANIAASTLLAEKASALVSAAQQSACDSVRNTATIGGNLANASPAADMAPPLLVMDADLLIRGPGGERVVAVEDFFTGPNETVVKPDELIIEVRVPPVKGKTTFLKLGQRKAMSCSVATVAVRLEMEGQTCKDARIALGSMAPTPLRCIKAEELLRDKSLDRASIVACAEAAVAESAPIDDQRATAWYRKEAGKTLVTRALAQVAGVEI